MHKTTGLIDWSDYSGCMIKEKLDIVLHNNKYYFRYIRCLHADAVVSITWNSGKVDRIKFVSITHDFNYPGYELIEFIILDGVNWKKVGF